MEWEKHKLKSPLTSAKNKKQQILMFAPYKDAIEKPSFTIVGSSLGSR